jgi:quercetin dioxygenase-like cupin family protein
MSGSRPAGRRTGRAIDLLAVAALALGLFLAGQMAEAQAPLPGVQEQIVLENDTVRVSLLVFPPGTASGEHVGLDPELGIVLAGELTLLTPAGREVLGPGAARWLPALLPHDARNEGTVSLRLWVVTVKR